MTIRQLASISLAALSLLSCATKQEEPVAKKEEDPGKPRIVGRIASIPADRKFVLIQAYGKWMVETGSVLTTLGPGGRAANLRATGEKLGQYAAADIQSGTVELGDGVYTIATPPKPPPGEGETPPPDKPVEEPAKSPDTPDPDVKAPSA